MESGLAANDRTGEVEASVRTFYDSYGWVTEADGKRGEDKTYRDFRPPYYAYAQGSQARTLALFPPGQDRLLIVGCGDMPDSHVAIAERFRDVTCIDISEAAIAIARQRLSRPIEAHVGSILDAPFADGTFDAVFCSHVLYHINADDQERAVRQMVRVTRPNGRVVILYFNPRSPLRALAALVSRVAGLLRRAMPGSADGTATANAAPDLYFHAFPLGWWRRFAAWGRVTLQPWEIVSAKVERRLLPSDGAARRFYDLAAAVEGRAPAMATKLWMYPIVVIEPSSPPA